MDDLVCEMGVLRSKFHHIKKLRLQRKMRQGACWLWAPPLDPLIPRVTPAVLRDEQVSSLNRTKISLAGSMRRQQRELRLKAIRVLPYACVTRSFSSRQYLSIW